MRQYIVVRADGKVFAGISSISRDARWFDASIVDCEYSDGDIVKLKRDARWLTLARKHDASADWKEI